jgi:hypothetical protein
MALVAVKTAVSQSISRPGRPEHGNINNRAPIRIDKPTEPTMNNWGLKKPFIPLADMALSYLFASAAVKPG